jgi:hypothetical protein
VSGDQVTTEVLNACHDNAISIRFQLSSESLPKPVEMIGDFTTAMAIASLSGAQRKKDSDLGYWLAGETRKLTLSYPGGSVPSADRVGDQIVVTAALFQEGSSVGDARALDGIKTQWIQFKSEFEQLAELFNAPEVKRAVGSREKLTRFSESYSRTRSDPTKASDDAKIPASGDNRLESPIVRSYTHLPTLNLLTDEQTDKVLLLLQQIVTKQLEEYRRLARVFNVPSLGEGEEK